MMGTSPTEAREAVARIFADRPFTVDPWEMWTDEADAVLAALAPIIAAEIRAWARETATDSTIDQLIADADAIASRICGSGS